MAQIATACCNFIEQTIEDALIIFLDYFTDSQRQATKPADIIARFNVNRINANEYTAAAIVEKIVNSSVYLSFFKS